MTSIEFCGVSKTFVRNAQRRLLRGHVTEWLKGGKEVFHALRDVSFRVESGEGVALIGANGAGKSTTLGLMAGLALPDSGQVRVDGRVAALLELGAGFHPDLTGRENVYLNASLLGISRKRANDCFEQLTDFSGVGEFIDEPLRTYSSGMMMRLAFSVAIHVDPEILIIDEVLGVGDQSFQAKCYERLAAYRRSGRTLLCVSHSPTMIKALCDRAIWLDHGRVVMDGEIGGVLAAYEGRTAAVAP